MLSETQLKSLIAELRKELPDDSPALQLLVHASMDAYDPKARREEIEAEIVEVAKAAEGTPPFASYLALSDALLVSLAEALQRIEVLEGSRAVPCRGCRHRKRQSDEDFTACGGCQRLARPDRFSPEPWTTQYHKPVEPEKE
jgi:hypothetical protein